MDIAQSSVQSKLNHTLEQVSVKMVNKPKMNFIEAISYIFYVTKFFGVIPYSLLKYHKQKVLANSYIGNIQSITSLIVFVFTYHYIVTQIYFDGKSFDSGNKKPFKSLKKKTIKLSDILEKQAP